MNGVARLILRLFAIYWIVSGLASCALVPREMFRFARMDQMPGVSEYAWAAASSLAVFLFLGVVPAVLVWRFSTPIANRLFPVSEAEAELQVAIPGLYVLGCSLLAIWFMISGVTGTVAYASALLLDLVLGPPNTVWRVSATRLPASLVEFVLGYVLWRYASNRAHAA